jgi:dCMP deaminase
VYNRRPAVDNKHKYFMTLAMAASKQTKCLKRKIGAVIVDDEFHVRAIGYNGVPKGYPHCTECKRDLVIDIVDGRNIAVPDCPSVHAEANALLQLEDKRHAIAMYTTTFPCIHCAKMICNTNIKNLYYLEDYKTDKQNEMTVLDMLTQADIIITKLKWEE